MIKNLPLLFYCLPLDNSPWRDDPEKDNSPACNGNTESPLATNGDSDDQSATAKEGDVVTSKTRLGSIEGKLIKTPFGTLVLI